MWEWTKGAWEAIRDWIQGAVDSLLGFFKQMLEQLWKMVNSVIEWIWETITLLLDWGWKLIFDEEEGFIWWAVEQMFDLGEWFVEQLPDLESILGEYAEPFRNTMNLIGRCDSFLPVTESVVLLGLFLAFITLYLVVKMIMKILPGVG